MYHILSALFEPLPLLFLLMGIAIAILWRKRAGSKGQLLFLSVVFLFLYLICCPAISYVTLGSLEWHYPPLDNPPDAPQAIVVLSGLSNVRLNKDGPAYQLLGKPTLSRCLRAADIALEHEPSLVLVSGGKVDPTLPGPTPAAMMRKFLLNQGVAPENILVEDRSTTTYENAVLSAEMLRRLDVVEIILVTDAIHLFRAERCFRQEGLKVIPAGCRYQADMFPLRAASFLPSPTAAKGFSDAWHEWMGVIWYWIHGRI